MRAEQSLLDWVQARPARVRHIRNIAWIVFVAAIGVMAIGAATRFAKGREGDFFHFYEAAKAVWQGQDLYASGTRGYIYPPLFAIVLSPLSVLSRESAGVVWTILNALLTGAVIVLAADWALRCFVPIAAQSTRRGGVALACTCALGLLFVVDKVRAVFTLGQTDALTLGLIVLALRAQRSRPILSGLCLGLAFNIKYQAVVFLPYLLLRGRFKEAGVMFASAIGVLLSGAVVFGWQRNLEYLSRAFGGLAEMVGLAKKTQTAADIHGVTWERSVSISSALARVGEHMHVGWLMPAGTLVAAAALAGITLMIYRRFAIPAFKGRFGEVELSDRFAPVVLLEWAGLIVAVLTLSPQSTIRHMYIVLLVTAVAAALLLIVKRYRLVLGLGVLVMVLGINLPPGGEKYEQSLNAWRSIAGPSVCVLAMYFACVWTGLAYLRDRKVDSR